MGAPSASDILDKAERWLADRLDYRFADPQLLRQALTHRSARGQSNERIEFLGDAVLDFVISDFVFRHVEDADEGDLSRLRASLVADASLARLAADIGLGEHLILGDGERKSGGHRRNSILADALEALFGAVFLDRGFDAARGFVERAFGDRLVDLPDPKELRDPKTRLQEWLQSRSLPLPEYALVGVTGKAHRQVFEVSCTVRTAVDDGTRVTHATGRSRRKAEKEAALLMLGELGAESS